MATDLPVQIEPSLGTPPAFRGSAGEPRLGSVFPRPLGNVAPVRFVGASPAPLLAMAAGMGAMGVSAGLDEPAATRSASGQIRPAPPSIDDLPFGRAFRFARNSGLKEFVWRGRRFTTRFKEE